MQATETMPPTGETIADSFVWVSYIDALRMGTFCKSVALNQLTRTDAGGLRARPRITLVPPLPLTKFCKISQKILASVEISRNLTNAN